MPIRDSLRETSRVFWVILFLNLLVAAAKIVYGLLSGAIAITADGVHSVLDGSSNVIGLVGVRIASRPPDPEHPYGHRKLETFAALSIAVLLLLACLRVLGAVVDRLREPRTPDIQPAAFAILLATMAVNLFVAVYERRQGERLRSEVLLADATHTRSDVWTTVLVIASSAAVRAGYAWADVAAALVVVGVIAVAGTGIVRRSLYTLSDATRIEASRIEAVALAVPGVMECHKVRSRGPAGDIHVDLHVLVDPSMPIAEAHEIGHQVAGAVRKALPDISDVVVHVEPDLEIHRLKSRETSS